jgi:sensor c-di-GMP phosphodiesterase-like protein
LKNFFSISTNALIFLIIAVIPTLIITTYAARNSFQQEERDIAQQLENVKNSLDFHISRVTTEVLTLKSEFRFCDQEMVDVFRDRIYSTPLLQEMYVINPKGEMVCNSHGFIADNRQYTQPPKSTKLRISGPDLSPFTKDFVLKFSSTGHSGNELTGLVSYLSLGRWIEAHLPLADQLWLKDSNNGKILYSNQFKLTEGKALPDFDNSQDPVFLGYSEQSINDIKKGERTHQFKHYINLRAINNWQLIVYNKANTPWKYTVDVWPWTLLSFLLFALIAFIIILNRQKRMASIEYKLRKAIDNKDFVLVYQPIVKLDDNQIFGSEALIRWRKEDKDVYFPDFFIPIAEQQNWIVELTHWIITQAIDDLAIINKQHPNFVMSINVAPMHFAAIDLRIAREALKKHPELRANQIKFELTERGMMDEGFDQLKEILSQAREMKFQIAIDDFGTGQSGFNYLSNLDFDLLKIDRQFVKAIGSGSVDEYLVDIIVDIAHRLDVKLIAEGIESEFELKHLLNRNVEFGQGYLYSKPLELNGLLSKYNPQKN